MSEKKVDARRINITVSEEIINFYQELSEEMGIPRSAVMVMAMKNYMDQQKSLKMGDMYKTIQDLINRLGDKEQTN